MEMGHGDEIVLADGNFPAASHSDNVLNFQGQGTVELLKAILRFFPLDTYVDAPVILMNPVAGDERHPPIWREYETILNETNGTTIHMEKLERNEFYHRSRLAYAIVATGEKAQYANIILKKGVL